MEARITVEQYFMYEVVATFNAVVEWVKVEKSVSLFYVGARSR